MASGTLKLGAQRHLARQMHDAVQRCRRRGRILGQRHRLVGVDRVRADIDHMRDRQRRTSPPPASARCACCRRAWRRSCTARSPPPSRPHRRRAAAPRSLAPASGASRSSSARPSGRARCRRRAKRRTMAPPTKPPLPITTTREGFCGARKCAPACRRAPCTRPPARGRACSNASPAARAAVSVEHRIRIEHHAAAHGGGDSRGRDRPVLRPRRQDHQRVGAVERRERIGGCRGALACCTADALTTGSCSTSLASGRRRDRRQRR